MNDSLGLVIMEEKVVVSSRDVARVFEKEHRRVTQDIRDLGCSEDFRLHNFVQSSYLNEQNREMPEYLMTRDGFTLLAMGYTGPKAMAFKEAYIEAFRQMEEAMRNELDRSKQYRELLALIRSVKGDISTQMMDALVSEAARFITGTSIELVDSTDIGITTNRAASILRAFLQDMEVSEDIVTSSGIYSQLNGWCSAKGVSCPSKNATGRALRALGFSPLKGGKGIRQWLMQ